MVHSKKPSNKDTNGKLALDNAIAALVIACINAPQHAPGGQVDQIWEGLLTKLPIRFDEDESQKLNESARAKKQNYNLFNITFSVLIVHLT